MNRQFAIEMLENLLERAKRKSETTILTSREIDALDVLVQESRVEPATSIGNEQASVQSPSVVVPVQIEDSEIPKDTLLCIDFGTSFSKSFASVDSGDLLPRLIDLPLGGAGSGKSSLVSPSELLFDQGRIYFGTNARKQFDDSQASPDRLIDSIKQYMTLGKEVSHLAKIKLQAIQDPSQSFFQSDILILYLAHLMYLTEQALISKGISPNALRRFAHPAWNDTHREGNEAAMKTMMAQAIVLARSLKDKLLVSISIAEARAALDQLQKLEFSELPLNLMDRPVREATAAGAGALFGGRPNSRESYLIIDVGAGTTDVAGCICRTNDEWERPRVWEVTKAADAIKSAGNILDDALLKLALNKCGLFGGSTEYQAAAISVRRDKRLYKEQLFDNGSVVIEMPTGDTVTIELQEFLDYPPVVDFTQRIRVLVGKAAIAVAGDYNQVNLVATGGGANLPMIRNLAEEGANYEGKHVSIIWRDSIPDGVAEEYPDLVAPYSQIAVALGGCLPVLPEQRASIAHGISGAAKTVLMPSYKS
ncbi:hypothetical protein ABIB06_004069 [Bradyrhizobium sp. LB8.2]|uniref:hypothetical protein n=1 Tax=Bradyrhizobium sp. LB8.2 TaxID=3156330 RepID=UPI003398A97A